MNYVVNYKKANGFGTNFENNLLKDNELTLLGETKISRYIANSHLKCAKYFD